MHNISSMPRSPGQKDNAIFATVFQYLAYQVRKTRLSAPQALAGLEKVPGHLKEVAAAPEKVLGRLKESQTIHCQRQYFESHESSWEGAGRPIGSKDTKKRVKRKIGTFL